ncbi:hypothetical protein BT67DRAFT_230674 [Trichocladium antarcticum]|uniref:Uncharacterized protein n=1 Tax=Trichocladium antarcticum TaxID=1450529 RepID=A0AAN6UN42_9PEZI|nr:hypothetical protein BT67DRAFT_230674 [Trichocladium antarcticum]
MSGGILSVLVEKHVMAALSPVRCVIMACISILHAQTPAWMQRAADISKKPGILSSRHTSQRSLHWDMKDKQFPFHM